MRPQGIKNSKRSLGHPASSCSTYAADPRPILTNSRAEVFSEKKAEGEVRRTLEEHAGGRGKW